MKSRAQRYRYVRHVAMSCFPDGRASAAPPTLSYASPQSWTYGAAITPVSPTTTGATSFAVQSGSLPTGVSLNISTGDITGTPTAWAASGSFKVTATGPGGSVESSLVSWTMAFVPATFGTCALWLKADGTLWQDSGRTTPAVADGDPVGAWDDGSGANRHATQSTAGARPTLQTAEQNGLADVLFDGVDDVLTGSLASAVNAATFFVVARFVAASGGGIIPFGYSDYRADLQATAWQCDWAGGGGSSVMVGAYTRNTTAGVFTVVRNSGASKAYRDGAQSGTTNATATGAPSDKSYALGNRVDLASYTNAHMCEVLIYNSALSDGNRALIESYLKARWGTP